MTDFDDIGISRQLDWERIKKLLATGFFASFLSFMRSCRSRSARF